MTTTKIEWPPKPGVEGSNPASRTTLSADSEATAHRSRTASDSGATSGKFRTPGGLFGDLWPNGHTSYSLVDVDPFSLDVVLHRVLRVSPYEDGLGAPCGAVFRCADSEPPHIQRFNPMGGITRDFQTLEEGFAWLIGDDDEVKR